MQAMCRSYGGGGWGVIHTCTETWLRQNILALYLFIGYSFIYELTNCFSCICPVIDTEFVITLY